MLKSLKGLVVLNAVLLVWNLLSVSGSAQRPPQANPEGTPYLPVNINPSDIPPMVNINPHDTRPKVDVTLVQEVARIAEVIRLPDVRVTPSGCAADRNFKTEIAKSIAGPLVVTYLNLPPTTQATLSGPDSSRQRVTLGTTTQLSTAIYLRAGQELSFEVPVMYSGCQPN